MSVAWEASFMRIAGSGSRADDFDQWSYNTATWQTPTSGVVFTSGGVTFTSASSRISERAGFTLGAGESVTVEVAAAPSTTNAGGGFFLTPTGVTGNRFGSTNGVFFQKPTTVLQLRATNNSTTFGVALTYDPVAHRFWRMRGTWPTWAFDTSPDGATWTQRFTNTVTGFDPVTYPYVGASLEGTSSTDNARFDNYNIVPADLVAPITVFVSETRTKVSAISGFTTTTVSWTVDENAAVWQIREVANASDPIGSAGVIVASGTNALTGVTQTTDIVYSSLSSGDGAKLLKIFAQDAAGNWSV